MKKKTIANAIMVAVIALIVVSGVLMAGNILGWFDKPDPETAMLTDVRGIVQMHRDGVSYTVEKDIVLRPGDVLSCEKGATATICVKGSALTIGEGSRLTVADPGADTFCADMSAGEMFASCTDSVTVRFADNTLQLQDAVAHISVRTGTQSISVFAGNAEGANAGQKLEYIGGEKTISALQIEALNDFTIACLRRANQTQSMYFTDAQLDALVAKRNEALEDIINSQMPTAPSETAKPTEPTHTHEYRVTVISATCSTGGYTEYVCTCGDRYVDQETAAKGHTWSEWVMEKEPTSAAEGKEKRTCIHCDAFEERAIAKLTVGHTHSYTEKTVAATCTTGGYTLHNCSCGISYKDKETAALGHSYTDNVTNATCTTDGYTLHTCAACGDSYTDTVIKAKGHSWSDWEVTKQPTTSQAGLQKRSCAVCKASEEETLPKLEITVAGYVYLTIRCDTILDNWDELNPAKAEFVPADGVILPRVKVAYAEGETVFDILVRVCEAAGIQLEYSWVPLYDAYYIEGIHNLYQFDCSSESGWMYKVNEWFPNYGVSAYTVKDGDVIDFLYTCHGYGTDVGAPEWEG